MSTIINIENYEAFYLDFLEGNLSEGDANALLMFLEQHPELQLEDDFLPALNVTAPAVSLNEFKQELKVFDDSELISPSNCEFFLIASVEGILSESKQRELDLFLLENTSYQREYNLYQASKLQADLSLHYPNPALLKRGVVIPMYVKLFAAAASVAGILWFSQFLPEKQGGEGVSMVSVNHPELKFEQIQQQTPDNIHQETQTRSVGSENPGTFVVFAVENNSNSVLLEAKKINRLNSKVVQFEREEVTIASVSMNPSLQNESNSEYLSLAEMKNPIKPITSEIKSRFNKDVDFRTAKASNTKQGGFYIKIGRFELSRKTAPEKETLASN